MGKERENDQHGNRDTDVSSFIIPDFDLEVVISKRERERERAGLSMGDATMSSLLLNSKPQHLLNKCCKRQLINDPT